MAIKVPNVFGLLSKHDIGGSIGYNEMHLRLLNESGNFVANPLSLCFSPCATQSIFPKD